MTIFFQIYQTNFQLLLFVKLISDLSRNTLYNCFGSILTNEKNSSDGRQKFDGNKSMLTFFLMVIAAITDRLFESL